MKTFLRRQDERAVEVLFLVVVVRGRSVLASAGQDGDLPELADSLPLGKNQTDVHGSDRTVEILHAALRRPDERTEPRISRRGADHASGVVDAERSTEVA